MNIVYTTVDEVAVKNENGTSNRKDPNCGSWISHWEKISKLQKSFCRISGCNNLATDGAHITRPYAKIDDYKTHSYILPMCPEHNGKHGEILLAKPGSTFVWANISETCGK
jgi:hypothetical protein